MGQLLSEVAGGFTTEDMYKEVSNDYTKRSHLTLSNIFEKETIALNYPSDFESPALLSSLLRPWIL